MAGKKFFGGTAGQRQWERPEGSRPAGPFQPSATFAGLRPGYLFTMGPKGLGYYQDQPGEAPSLLPCSHSALIVRQLAAPWDLAHAASLCPHQLPSSGAYAQSAEVVGQLHVIVCPPMTFVLQSSMQHPEALGTSKPIDQLRSWTEAQS